jgi:hypothetical protein
MEEKLFFMVWANKKRDGGVWGFVAVSKKCATVDETEAVTSRDALALLRNSGR